MPTNRKSRYMKKCSICLRPYSGHCTNCGYDHDGDKKGAKDSHDREKNLELFIIDA
jgi:hypothetical protein